MFRNIFIIAAKDFKALVFSPALWIISGMCASVWSYVFLRRLNDFAQRSAFGSQPFGGGQPLNIYYMVFADHISLSNIILLFLIPALTMKLLSEEKKQGTYSLLLTLPISSASISIGKFFAGFGASLVLVGLSLLYPLGTALVADFNVPMLFLSYSGLILLAGIYVSIGLFASSLTESPVLSVMMGIVFNLIVIVILGQIDFFSGTGLLKSIIEYLSIGTHFVNFIKGSLQTQSVIYMVSFISLFVFLTQRVIEVSRLK